MKIACIYHRVDLDGWMSAAIVKHYYQQQNIDNNETTTQINFKNEGKYETIPILYSYNELNFIGFHYGDSIPNLSEYDKVIMCDISFPIKNMIELGNRLHMNFIYIDHHISAILPIEEEIRNNNTFVIRGIRKTEFSACELTWYNFFPNDTMPEIVRLLGRYDCFGHKNTSEEKKVLEFQYGARECISNYKEAYNWLQSVISDENPKHIERTTIKNTYHYDLILDKGRSIYQYLCTEAKQDYKNTFPITFFEKSNILDIENNPGNIVRKFLTINKQRFNPINFGIDYHKDGYDGFACFWYTSNGKWNWSLYNDNGEVDCSLIAKQFGGGGHKGAAGFIQDTLNFNF